MEEVVVGRTGKRAVGQIFVRNDRRTDRVTGVHKNPRHSF